ncbi:23S rRNA pseudouridine2604 synthase [Rhodoferax ferrireducens]|uniref:Dual-specificity RNA pseudouridine synthase RluF n=1 Tax=Rhodoferax ferrireducens TaxID=192843 RepID=A0ABU2CCV6_9BURK|nr:RNA pseudouridine synthase [Rhodoferax ferrireducens]MDR7379159.1 23S rRNA pseudouridine2604 synthase [Rhodoferax ferrireducens]
MTEPVRLAKRLAEQLACSRREAEQYIEGGWVRVDGQLVEEPMFRVTTQKIEVDPDATLLAPPTVTLLLHKPVGFTAGLDAGPGPKAQAALALLTRENHAPDDRSGIRTLKKHFAQLRLATPMDSRASGLVVYTQDGRVVRKLEEDADLIEHEVIVEVAGEVTPGMLRKLADPVQYHERLLAPAKVSVSSQNEDAAETKLRFALKGERPGQIDYLCESAGLQIRSVKRIRVGRVPMTALAPGQWRYLAEHERF